MKVSEDVLLKGAWYSIEQSGWLFGDAVTLYSNRRYAGAVALTLLAREELGRYRILLELWRKAVNGKPVSVVDVRAAADDHVIKQRAAQLSVVYRAESGGVSELLRVRLNACPGTLEWEKADEQLKRLDEKRLRRTPSDRHSTRMRAMYVDVNDGGTDWNRPAAFPEGEATNCVVDGVNDYAVQVDKLNQIEMLKEEDAPLAAALDAWVDKPPLPAPKWPG